MPLTISISGDATEVLAAISYLKGLLMTDTSQTPTTATATALAALKAAVANEQTVEASAKALIAGIPGVVAAAVKTALANVGADDATTAAAIQDATDTVNANMADLSSAVTANTPAPAPAPAGLSITTTSLPAAEIGQPYSGQIETSGGTAPVTFAGSSLPDGLILDSTSGAISGTPAADATSASISVTATDSSSPPQTASASLSISVSVPPPTS